LTGNAKETKTAVSMAVFFSALFLIFNLAHAQGLKTLDQEITRIVDQISGSVVTVEARPQESHAPVFPGQRRSLSEPVKSQVGSGLLIDSVGHILTCLGLVDGCDDFRVEFGGRGFAARMIGVDRRHNLAVLRIDTVLQSYINVSSIPPMPGRLALAYGNAIGHTGYPALGIIAGRQNDGSYLVSGSVLPGLLGGGVFNLSGELIGVISSGSVTVNDYRGTWGGIIMLPALTAYSSANRIICCGNRDAGYLGVKTTAIELVSPNKEILGEAVVVSDVVSGSPAALAGFRIGDIITRVGLRNVSSDPELQRMVNSAGADSTVRIEFIRGQRHLNMAVSLSSLSNQRDMAGYAGQVSQAHDQTLIAIELQKRIDLMRIEMQRLQKQLEKLLDRTGSAR
jgi:S1-C subfamily serine protease